ncbi:hypothetical protein [Paenibacillus sp. HB172176]|uniref:hypothetical protein n=1 Tax=Paenibacillus sp. HB172176 TaxID=2493690 RepID=UPI00143A7411|nr:hypothetical protein [Paenibacillus sp. HB172176]
MKNADWDQMIRQSLSSTAAPDEKLNANLILEMKRKSQIKRKPLRKLTIGLAAAVIMLTMTITVYAATQLFSAKQIAEELDNQLLADAFESKDAIQMNESQDSRDYHVTLHGIVSGAGLQKYSQLPEDIYPDKTYAVVSITRRDGKPMPDTADPEYGEEKFFISPLIRGQKPWQVNIASMNGGYSDLVIEGVLYRLIECDQVEMFADRGLYLAVSSGGAFFSKAAFSYDEQTGKVRAREDYQGTALLFDLPLDPAKANHEEADAYLETLLNPPPPTADPIVNKDGEEWIAWINRLRDELRNGESIGETIPESIQEVTYEESGKFNYTFGDRSVTMTPEELFEEGQTGFSNKRLPISRNEEHYTAMLFHRDKAGVITGRIVILD